MSNPALTYFLEAISFCLGGILGSFANVWIWRIPKKESVVYPGSKCPKCGAAIGWLDNIPLLSFVMLGGRCRYCKERISWRYPVVELITALLFFVVFLKFGIKFPTVFYALFCWALVIITFIDLEHYIIPDLVTFPGIVLGLLIALTAGLFRLEGFIPQNPWDSLIGIISGGLIIYVVDIFSRAMFKKPGMGGGDVKLLAMIGAFLGWKLVLLTILISSFVGAVVGLILIALGLKSRHDYIPFGPYLAVAAVVCLFFGQDIIAFWAEHFWPKPSGNEYW